MTTNKVNANNTKKPAQYQYEFSFQMGMYQGELIVHSTS